MAKITFKGTPTTTQGDLPQTGRPAPDFTLTKTDLSDVTLSDFKGKRVVLNIFPSVDTPVCATSVRRFNQEASKLDNCVVLCVSRDLPFAHARFCGAEGLNEVVSVSDFRTGSFGGRYGVVIAEGPLKGLLSRAVVIVDEKGTVVYTQQVPEIAEEPDYAAALAALA
ncbi:MAG: thiol peroxidase [Desulfobacterales bacterium]